jgi:drug/metabolite transporter (DMT)-like permease
MSFVSSHSRAFAYLALVATAALWGSNAVAARGLLDSLSPETLALLRWGIALVALAPFVWRERSQMRRSLRRDWKMLSVLALTGFAPNALLSYCGLRGSTAIIMGLCNSIVPVVVLLMVAVWKRRRPRRLESIGIALSLCGVVGILAHGSLAALLTLSFSHYDLIVLLGLIVWALYSVLMVEKPADLSIASYTFLAGVLSIVMILPFVIWDWTAHGLPDLTLRECSLSAYIAIMPTLVAMLLFAYAIAKVGPIQCGIFTHGVPLFSALFATLFLGETLHVYHAVGFVLIAGGAILCCLKPEKIKP